MAAARKQAPVVVQFDELFKADDGSPAPPEDNLGPAQLVELAERLDISPDGQAMYLLMWRLNCQTPCAVSRTEWSQGLSQLGVTSIAGIKDVLGALKRDVNSSPQRQRAFYNFVFEWSRETPSVRSVSAEVACALWPMVFEGRPWKWLPDWLTFIAQHQNDRPVKRDVWKMTFDFAAEDLENYSTDSSWPTAMDEFVAWLKQQGKLPATR